MYELIISSANTGRVQHKTFATLEEANAFEERFFSTDRKRPRQRCDYRVETKRVQVASPMTTTAPILARAA